MTKYRIIEEVKVVFNSYTRGFNKDDIYRLEEKKVYYRGAHAWVMVINPNAKDKNNNCIAYPVPTKYVKFVPNED